MSNVINRVEASALFIAVKKLGIEEKLSMDLESIETLVTVKCWLRGNNTKWYDNVHDEDADMRVVADEMV